LEIKYDGDDDDDLRLKN